MLLLKVGKLYKNFLTEFKLDSNKQPLELIVANQNINCFFCFFFKHL